jgi:uncharacterized protein YaaQ
MSSSSRFARTGNTTLPITTDDTSVPQMPLIIRKACQEHSDLAPAEVAGDLQLWYSSTLVEVAVDGATVRLLTIERHLRVD